MRIDEYELYDQVDYEDISDADRVREAAIDAYEGRPRVTVRHVLVVQDMLDWYDQNECVIEFGGLYFDEQ